MQKDTTPDIAAGTSPPPDSVLAMDGPVLYFGDSHRLAAKWAAASRVLADASSRGATYLDLRLPERPAARAAPTGINWATARKT